MSYVGSWVVEVVIDVARPGGRVQCVCWKFNWGVGNMWEGEGIRCGMSVNVWCYMYCIVYGTYVSECDYREYEYGSRVNMVVIYSMDVGYMFVFGLTGVICDEVRGGLE